MVKTRKVRNKISEERAEHARCRFQLEAMKMQQGSIQKERAVHRQCQTDLAAVRAELEAAEALRLTDVLNVWTATLMGTMESLKACQESQENGIAMLKKNKCVKQVAIAMITDNMPTDGETISHSLGETVTDSLNT